MTFYYCELHGAAWLKQITVNIHHCLLYIVYMRQCTDTVTRLLLIQFIWLLIVLRREQSQLAAARLLAQ